MNSRKIKKEKIFKILVIFDTSNCVVSALAAAPPEHLSTIIICRPNDLLVLPFVFTKKKDRYWLVELKSSVGLNTKTDVTILRALCLRISNSSVNNPAVLVIVGDDFTLHYKLI